MSSVEVKRISCVDTFISSGPTDFYVIEGEIEYRGGTIKKGDWAYEAAGSLRRIEQLAVGA